MTDKRFIFDPSISHFEDTQTDKTYCEYNLDKVVDLLNEQHEQICQLKNELEDALLDVKIYKNANTTFDNVYQENEKLKSRIEYLERKIQRERNATTKQHLRWSDEAEIKIKELSEENEELKEKLCTEKPILDYFNNRHFYIRDMTTEELKEWNKTISKVM